MWKLITGKRIAYFLLLLLAMDLMTAEDAEARKRAFGRRPRNVSARRNRNPQRRAVAQNRRGNNRNFNNFNDRININDPFALGRREADILSSLTLDPTGSLQRLAIAPNILVDRNGRFFEANGLDSLGVRQPLAFSNGQFFGGQERGVSQDTLRQMGLVNQTGNFDTLPFQ